MNSVNSNLQIIFYLKFSMRKDVVDYSPWFPTGNAKAIIDFNRKYTTVHFRKEKKMSECEFPNSVSIGSKLDQENHENSPKIARGATFSDVDRGWAFVVLLSSSACMFVGATLGYGTGVVHVALLEKFKKDAAFTSLIGSIFFSLLSLMGKQIFLGDLINLYIIS